MFKKKSFLSLFIIVLLLFSADAYMETKDIFADYRSRGIEIYSVESGDLTENAECYQDAHILTVIKVKKKPKAEVLYALEVDSGSWTHDIRAVFADKNQLAGLRAGDLVAVVGKVGKARWNQLADVVLTDCQVIFVNLEASKLQSELVANKELAVWDRQKLTRARYEKDLIAYKAKAVAPDYEQVARNPDQFRNQIFSVNGTVVGTIEYVFRYTEILLRDYRGNLWVVYYVREDGGERFLVNDRLEVYGISSGIKTFVSGESQVFMH
ncbi:MAG: hypothetical protein ACOX62_07920 [Christensenellales bacterium]